MTDRHNEPMAELLFEDILEGSGRQAIGGSRLAVHYAGTFDDGREFDSSKGREPIRFRLGLGQVIRGWDEGLVGMRVGGRRKLVVPSELGYGERGAGDSVPPNSTLYFDVVLVEVED